MSDGRTDTVRTSLDDSTVFSSFISDFVSAFPPFAEADGWRDRVIPLDLYMNDSSRNPFIQEAGYMDSPILSIIDASTLAIRL
jgi:hypothetical protein